MSRRYPDRPLIGVGAILFAVELDRVLLIRRAAPPAQGLWSIPGGLVEVGEGLERACRREVQEEVGLQVELQQVAKLVERIIPDAAGEVEYHYLIVDFWGIAPTDVEPIASSDASAARWVPLAEIPELPTTRGLPRAIKRALSLARGEQPDSPLLECFVGVSG